MNYAAILSVLISVAALYSNNEAKIQRMLYVVPEALPKNHPGKIFGLESQITVWAGARLDKDGHLKAAQTQYLSGENHLLVGLTSAAAGEAVLTKPRIRKKSIREITNFTAGNRHLAGIQLDFEYLDPALGDAFTAYAADLLKAIQPRKLFVAVFPPKGMPARWSAFHKLTELAGTADGLVVMLYDLHRQGTKPGCVSGIHWLTENAAELARLPRSKIWLGAPLYGYRFEKQKAIAISKKSFEKTTGSAATNDGCLLRKTTQMQVYYPAPQLYEHYDGLVRDFGFAGVAYWRAGLER